MPKIENVFKWCLIQGGKGKKHKGIRKIEPDADKAEAQIEKALSDLETMKYLYDGKKTDWAASAAFYSMYHSLLAILYKLGYESRNQECTINAVEYFIKNKILNIDWDYINMVRRLEREKGEDAKSTREEMQYGEKTSLEDERCRILMANARKFVEKMRAVLKEISL